jgi:hypothetical protein
METRRGSLLIGPPLASSVSVIVTRYPLLVTRYSLPVTRYPLLVTRLYFSPIRQNIKGEVGWSKGIHASGGSAVLGSVAALK